MPRSARSAALLLRQMYADPRQSEFFTYTAIKRDAPGEGEAPAGERAA